MGIETRMGKLPDYISPDIREQVSGLVVQPISRFVSERMMQHAEIDFPQELIIEYVNSIDAGYLPILVTNHASHADAVTSAKLMNLLRKLANRTLPADQQIMGFNVPMAASLPSGLQGSYLRQVLYGSQPIIEANGFFSVPIVRGKDKKPVEEGGYGMADNSRDYLKTSRTRIEEGYAGFLLYPEGTTESGKTGENGKPIGMIPFEEEAILNHVRLLEKYSGKKAMIIYAGITGSTDAIDPNTKKASLNLIKKVLRPQTFRIKVGGIIRTDEPEFRAMLKGYNPKQVISTFVARKIALLLPPEMRGVYGKPEDDLSEVGL